MANESEFLEAYKDPQWQKKRLEVMEREFFSCEECGSQEKTLNVHHSYYVRGRKPWEYPSEHLHCLCEGCHKDAADVMLQIKLVLGPMTGFDLKSVLRLIRQHRLSYCDHEEAKAILEQMMTA